MDNNTQVKYKCCSKCGESKPATKEFFHARKSNKDGLRGECKVCVCNDQRSAHDRRPAHTRWNSMMSRCYNVNNNRYNIYGEKGVTVCEDWKDYNTFSKWYDENSIIGWEMDKDIVGTGDCYSPESCVFVPNAINMFFTFTKLPSVLKTYNKYRISTGFKGKTCNISGDTEEDVLEQFYLFKELYLEKLVWEMKQEHKKLCEKYPNTPEISPKLLSIIENFSTEEYLERKNNLNEGSIERE